MTIKHIQHIVLATLVALSAQLPACAQEWDKAVMGDSILHMDSTLFLNNAQQLYRYYFIEGVAQQNNGNSEEAARLFKRCIELNPQAAEAYYQLAGYCIDQKDEAGARHNYQLAAELQPKNNAYQESLGMFYIQQGEYQSAIPMYEQLYANNKSRADVVEMLYRLYYTDNNFDKMLEQLDRMESIEGPTEQIALTRMQIYAKQGKTSKQLDELKNLVAKHPNDANYRIMMANWLINNDKPKEALTQLNIVLKDEPDNASAQMSLLDYYRATGNNAKANNLLNELLFSSKVPQNSRLTLLQQMVYHNRENQCDDSLKTLQIIDRLLAVPQEKDNLYLFKAAYMQVHNMPQDSINAVLEQALTVEPDDAAARWQLISNIWSGEDWERIINLSRPAQEYNPTEMLFYYSQGMAEYQLDRRDDALTTFQKGVAQINKDSDATLASDFYAIMGDLLHDRGREAEAFEAYENSLSYKADNISCLNNYAYYLCMKDSLMDRAEQMSRKTIEAEPDNATYLDTYAWILFCQGRYAEALSTMEHAVEADTTLSSVVKEHMGDIYAMNGNIEKAVEYWQMALSFDKENAVLQEKIRQRKYIKQ